jgi:N-dimethylarginine dimethylaminohydrolase
MQTETAGTKAVADMPHAEFNVEHTQLHPGISSCSSVLMVSPTFFDVQYAINPWMERGLPVDTMRAKKQWANLKRHLEVHVDVEVAEGLEGMPDLCFVANAGILFNDMFVPSNFRHLQRRPEVAYFERCLVERGYTVARMPAHLHFEGAGDALFDKTDALWLGYGQRSDRRAAAWLRTTLDCPVYALELRDPNFYHLDTCFCPLESGHLVYYPGAFAPDALALIRSHVPSHHRIELDRCDAMGFACNLIELPEVVITSYASARFRAQMMAIGKATAVVQLDEFIKAGGGARCLSFRLNGST